MAYINIIMNISFYAIKFFKSLKKSKVTLVHINRDVGEPFYGRYCSSIDTIHSIRKSSVRVTGIMSFTVVEILRCSVRLAQEVFLSAWPVASLPQIFSP